MKLDPNIKYNRSSKDSLVDRFIIDIELFCEDKNVTVSYFRDDYKIEFNFVYRNRPYHKRIYIEDIIEHNIKKHIIFDYIDYKNRKINSEINELILLRFGRRIDGGITV